MNKESMEILAKLRTGIAIRDAQIMANPMPALKRAEKALIECMACFDELQKALSPDVVYEVADSMGIRPQDFQGGDRVKMARAMDVLDRYYRGGFKQ